MTASSTGSSTGSPAGSTAGSTPAQRLAATVQLLETVRTADGRRPRVRAVTVTQGAQRLAHVVDGRPADVRSISKVAVAAAVGVAIDRGERWGSTRLTPDAPVGELIAQVPALAALPRPAGWADVRLAHLLDGTIGHDTGFLFRRDIGDRDPDELPAYLFARPLDHPPGRHFAYSNAGPFLVSILVQELIGQRLGAWVGERVLAPAGITGGPTWRRYGAYDAGGTGLRLDPHQLHALADLFRYDGVAGGPGGVRVLAPGRIRTMTTPSAASTGSAGPVRPDDPLPKAGYGQGLWVCGDGRYFGDGTDGQFLIVDPARDLAVSALGDEPDMAAVRACLAPLLAPS
ncbi:serine hydrolase domain-containing protein [Nakamurella sp.]|uniref:serine hydrolase domain-containing protein n=1 Tax=Nakamurella sp. TaxID=1869182 RepID=UPI003B3BC6FB